MSFKDLYYKIRDVDYEHAVEVCIDSECVESNIKVDIDDSNKSIIIESSGVSIKLDYNQSGRLVAGYSESYEDDVIKRVHF